jgi:hypothetical protein
LLADVALHKSRYFASSWARYDTARPGAFKLVPPPHRWAAVGEDYAQMRPMFMKEPPAFGDLLQQLSQAEQVLNRNERSSKEACFGRPSGSGRERWLRRLHNH